MRNLAYLQSELNKSKTTQLDQSLYQVINGILGLEAEDSSISELVADPLKFVLDPDTGLYLQNTDQSGPSEFPFRVGIDGKIYERYRTVALGDWQSYTPVWTSTGGPAPVMGASTLTGAYALAGNICEFYFRLVLGAGFAFGGGAQVISLPQTLVAPLLTFGGRATLAGVNYTPQFLNASTTTVIPFTNAAPNAIYTAAVPGAWAAADNLFGMGSYRI